MFAVLVSKVIPFENFVPDLAASILSVLHLRLALHSQALLKSMFVLLLKV